MQIDFNRPILESPAESRAETPAENPEEQPLFGNAPKQQTPLAAEILVQHTPDVDRLELETLEAEALEDERELHEDEETNGREKAFSLQ